VRPDQHLLHRTVRALSDIREELRERILLWHSPLAPQLLDELVATAVAVRQGSAELIELSAVQVLLDAALEEERRGRDAEEDATLYVCATALERWVEHVHSHLPALG
jgi:hypothetical protein